MQTLGWMRFWLSEVYGTGIAALGAVTLWSAIVYGFDGVALPLDRAALLFGMLWSGLLVLASSGIVAKLRVWRELRRLPPEQRTLETARARLRARSSRRA